MKAKIIIASMIYFVGIAKIIDWIIFWHNNKNLALSNRAEFLNKYVSRFPVALKSLIENKPETAAIISILFFAVAGWIFIKQESKVFKFIAVTAFLFAFWNLFSLM